MKTPDSIHRGYVRGQQIGSNIVALPGLAIMGLGFATGATAGIIVGASKAIYCPIAKKFKEGMAKANCPADPPMAQPVGTADSVNVAPPGAAPA